MKRTLIVLVAALQLIIAVPLPTPKDDYLIRENTPENCEYIHNLHLR